MKILLPNDGKSKNKVTELNQIKNGIFLAGPCPRSSDPDYGNWEWREEAVKILTDLEPDNQEFTILNPTNPFFKNINLELQIHWELEAMSKASVIIFWIPRSKEHPAMITNFELGQWWGKKGVYVGWPENSWKNEYPQIRLDMMGQRVYHSLEDLISTVVGDLTRESKTFFTADTHFSQKRTLELSRRPFCSVEDMDFNLISNWNKSVRMSDTVFHLGDFGEDFHYLDCLNFKELYLVPGNYEYQQWSDLDTFRIQLESYENVHLLEPDEMRYIDDKTKKVARLIHKPIFGQEFLPAANNDFFFGGHIHGRSLYKRNYIDCGVDGNQYQPIDEEKIRWMREAVEKYVDENVFTDKAYQGQIEEKH